VIDTGIRYTHGQFSGRISPSYHHDVFTDGQNGADCNGHGTHVAGTIGGSEHGVAKGVQLVAVRVLDCRGSGTTSGVIAGVDWVKGQKQAYPARPMVANMSLGGGASSSLDAAVKALVQAGVATAVAAGNGNNGGKEQDACNYSPARVAEALTVGATTQSDSKTSWSNYGACVNLFAPGSGITSAWYTADNATYTISGTSMASPHVAGVAALFLEGTPSANWSAVNQAVLDATTKGVVTNSKTASNHLLYSGIGGGSGGTTDPVADPTAPPAAPTGLAVTGTTAGSVSLAWTDASSDESGFEVYRSDTAGFTPSSSNRIASLGANVTQFSDNGVSPSTTYHYRVAAVNVAGRSLSAEVTATTAEAAVIQLAVRGYKRKGQLNADLDWSGATSQQVDIWRQNGTTGGFFLLATVANSGKYTDSTNFVGGGTLTYRVCEAGSAAICSADVSITF